MPRLEGPRKYLPRELVLAMKVAKPYRQVADWCGGRVVLGQGNRFAYIHILTPDGQMLKATEGSYIEKLRRDFQLGEHFAVWRAEDFENHYREARKDER